MGTLRGAEGVGSRFRGNDEGAWGNVETGCAPSNGGEIPAKAGMTVRVGK